ncbi:MAG: hypothetical protein HKN13_11625 [Rhodothermales bacterium]|nr:hypothetical protein [Rhodothermales bacterium]
MAPTNKAKIGYPFRRTFPVLAVYTTVAIVFTAAVIQFSLFHGQLRFALPAHDDDAYYMRDGIARLEVLYDEGLIGLSASLTSDPPKSPYSTLAAMAGFLVFGVHDWAPYATNVGIILLLLLFIDRVFRHFSLRVRFLLALFALTCPFVSVSVYSFKPHLLSGLVCAIAVVALFNPTVITRPRLRYVAAGVGFALAMIIKPTAAPYYAGVFAATLSVAFCAEVLLDRAKLRLAVARSGISVGVLLVVALPYFATNGRFIARYIFRALVSDRHLWVDELSTLDHALYYLTGQAGEEMLSSHGYILVSLLCIAGLTNVRWRWRKAESYGLIAILLIMAVAWLVPTIASVKNREFGGLFFFLLLFSSMTALAHSLRLRGLKRRTLRRHASIVISAALVVGGLACAKWPNLWSNADQMLIDTAGGGLINEIDANLIEQELRAGVRLRPFGATVQLTVWAQFFNKNALEYLAKKRGRNNYRFRTFFADDEAQWQRLFDEADFVIAHGGRSSVIRSRHEAAQVTVKSFRMIRARDDFVELASFPISERDRIFLFGRNFSRGVWDSGADYRPGEIVELDGQRFACIRSIRAASQKRPGTGEDWTRFWRLLGEPDSNAPTR